MGVVVGVEVLVYVLVGGFDFVFVEVVDEIFVVGFVVKWMWVWCVFVVCVGG